MKNTSMDLWSVLLEVEVHYGKGNMAFARRDGNFGGRYLGSWLAWTPSLERRQRRQRGKLR